MNIHDYSQWLQAHIGLSPAVQTRLLATFVILFFLGFVRKIILRVIASKQDDIKIRYRWSKTTAYVNFLIAFLIIGRIWFEGFQSMATFFGLLSAGLAIALKDPLSNMAGWAFIMWRKPFRVGDRIEVAGYAGDVIDIRIFQFTLLEIGHWVAADQSTGRVVHVLNCKVFTEMQANYTAGFEYTWHEIPVQVTFESNWEKAKKILGEAADHHAEKLSDQVERKIRKASRKFLIFYSKLTPIVYTTVKESGILLTIRYLCNPRERRGSEEAIWEYILKEFAKAGDIDFAYPTTRFYNHLKEGKKTASAAKEIEN